MSKPKRFPWFRLLTMVTYMALAAVFIVNSHVNHGAGAGLAAGMAAAMGFAAACDFSMFLRDLAIYTDE